MTTHPLAGKPVKILSGPLKGQYFIIVDWLSNQFQGKDLTKLQKSKPALFNGLKKRGVPIDDKLVWGKLYPEMNFLTVHDSEIKSDLKAIDGGGEKVELPPNVAAISSKRKPKVVTTKKKEKKNDSTGASGSDHHPDEPGSSGDAGRGVSGPEVHNEHERKDQRAPEAGGDTGGDAGGEDPGSA